jgi:hypothetical protein
MCRTALFGGRQSCTAASQNFENPCSEVNLGIMQKFTLRVYRLSVFTEGGETLRPWRIYEGKSISKLQMDIELKQIRVLV